MLILKISDYDFLNQHKGKVHELISSRTRIARRTRMLQSQKSNNYFQAAWAASSKTNFTT